MASITLEKAFNPMRKCLVTPITSVSLRGVNVFKIHFMKFSETQFVKFHGRSASAIAKTGASVSP